jgi:peptidylprolyl isomerase
MIAAIAAGSATDVRIGLSTRLRLEVSAGRAAGDHDLCLRDCVALPAVKVPILTIAVCAALAFAGCGDDDSTTDTAGGGETTAERSGTAGEGQAGGDVDTSKKPEVEVPSEAPPKNLAEREIVAGDGPTAEAGDQVSVQYVGVGYESGEEFDSSWSRGEPFSFQLAAGQVIPGWDQGVKGMKVGGRRELIIPPDLAYGEAGAPPSIGPNETLIFVVDLVSVE